MRYPLFGVRRRESLGSLKHYLIGLALVVGAVILRLMITSQMSASAPFITFFPATALAALIGGLGPGVMVAACGALIASTAFFPRPITEFVTEDWVLLGFYLVTEVVICLVIDAMHSANSRYLTLIEEVQSKRGADHALRDSGQHRNPHATGAGEGVRRSDVEATGGTPSPPEPTNAVRSRRRGH